MTVRSPHFRRTTWSLSSRLGCVCEPPSVKQEATGDQLSALRSRWAAGLTPFADFAVWRPQGARLLRQLKFQAHFPHREAVGEPKRFRVQHRVQIGGAAGMCLPLQWRFCKLRRVPRLEVCFAHDRKLANTHPDNWWITPLADSRCRSEHLERVRRVAVVDHAAGRLADFEPERPWDIVFSRGHEGPTRTGQTTWIARRFNSPPKWFLWPSCATKVLDVWPWPKRTWRKRGEEGEEDCEQEAHEIGVVEPITSPTRTTNKGADKGKSWDARAPESIFETLEGLNCVGLGMRPLLDVRKFARHARASCQRGSILGCAKLASSGSVIKDVYTCFVSRGGEELE